MHMNYWLGKDLGTFLFNGYQVKTTQGLIFTCLSLISLAIIYEAMKILQVKLREITMESVVTQSIENSSLISRTSERSNNFYGSSLHCCTFMKWIFEIIHWSSHVFLGYILMLAVMTYNGYITIAIVFGSGIGYFLFGPVLQEKNILKVKAQHKIKICDPSCADVNEEDNESPNPSTSNTNYTEEIS